MISMRRQLPSGLGEADAAQSNMPSYRAFRERAGPACGAALAVPLDEHASFAALQAAAARLLQPAMASAAASGEPGPWPSGA
ncbi:hypothetical protein WJX81_004174 [Elliptochloris bilobata]|uniref:Uncharacterized protein n=1 Tax=Elliptochloris bilobata TaxID=381761 RepID=A0AAW1RNL7_9CHLO